MVLSFWKEFNLDGRRLQLDKQVDHGFGLRAVAGELACNNVSYCTLFPLADCLRCLADALSNFRT